MDRIEAAAFHGHLLGRDLAHFRLDRCNPGVEVVQQVIAFPIFFSRLPPLGLKRNQVLHQAFHHRRTGAIGGNLNFLRGGAAQNGKLGRPTSSGGDLLIEGLKLSLKQGLLGLNRVEFLGVVAKAVAGGKVGDLGFDLAQPLAQDIALNADRCGIGPFEDIVPAYEIDFNQLVKQVRRDLSVPRLEFHLDDVRRRNVFNRQIFFQLVDTLAQTIRHGRQARIDPPQTNRLERIGAYASGAEDFHFSVNNLGPVKGLGRRGVRGGGFEDIVPAQQDKQT